MIPSKTKDWNPETYARFRGLRLRPALDLLSQVGDLPDAPIVDLGCGAGAVGQALVERYPTHKLLGVDNSPAMLRDAEETGLYAQLELTDASEWRPEEPPALIFSNALLHWLPDHQRLFPKLAEYLEPGGVLAIQMPRQQMAPSHALMRDIAQKIFPEVFDFSDWEPQVAQPESYAKLLSVYGSLNLWETSYLQVLSSVEEGHPVRHFTQSTAMRPFASALSRQDFRKFLNAYDAALSEAYPLADDGSVSFQFQRMFIVLST